MPSTIFLATCAEFPDGWADEDALVAACAQRGLDAHWQVWDDPAVDWAAADLVVLRSTWDYTPRRQEFLDWAASVPRLANRFEVVAWNSDKRYLADLAAAGVPVVPTTWAAPGHPVELPTDGEYVIKPSIGAGSRGTARFTAGPATSDQAHDHARALHRAGRTVMIQPYVGDVDAAGETALVYLGGEYSHSIRKGPMLAAGAVNAVDADPLFIEENISLRRPSEPERAVAESVLAAAPRDLLYARVDLLPGADGPVLIELELTEPSLFLTYGVDAVDRLASAIGAWAAR